MPLVKLIAASLLIPMGLIFLLAIATEMSNPDATPESKLSITVGSLLLGIPAMGLGIGLVWSGLKQQQWQQQQRQLHSIFLRVLREYEGRITPSELMSYTQISAQEAQRFLDEKAQKFAARVEVQSSGERLYWFPME
ncbi:MAG: hypothetical protein HC835_00060 [Oscillatoriales cyanobacterium RM2_1_1]|nr:hypothetical protein [Oscillatoriales cyanobacterium SM2_3_0]NJO44148.1 hypothetical protein [Oscillatoriales cyanobacterium RM2_1_1]